MYQLWVRANTWPVSQIERWKYEPSEAFNVKYICRSVELH